MINSNPEEVHQANLGELAEELARRMEIDQKEPAKALIQPIYINERKVLEDDARVERFIPTLAYRRTREILKDQY